MPEAANLDACLPKSHHIVSGIASQSKSFGFLQRSSKPGSSGDLGGEACGVPILPGFDEFAVLDADDGGSGNVRGPVGGNVLERSVPVDAGEVRFGEDDDRGDLEIGKLRAQATVEIFEFGGGANDRRSPIYLALAPQ